MKREIELLVDAHALLGEGPSWESQRRCLYWVDIIGSKLHVYQEFGYKDTAFDIGQYIGAAVPRSSGGLMLACHHGFAAFEPDANSLSMISDPEAGIPENRFNDGKCDPEGRFWAGTMAIENPVDQGSLYRLDADLEVHKVLDNIGISNGLAWSLDHSTMYYVDSTRWTIIAFDFDLDTGDLFNQRNVIDVPKDLGCADGMTIDSEGMLWVAHYGSGIVCRWHPAKSRILETINLPVSLTTSCAFGGDSLDTLFITSASIGLKPRELANEPHAGGLFCVNPGVRGLPSSSFAG